MGFWNYRVVRRIDGEDISYQIHEAYYNEEDRNNREAVPHSITENAITLYAESVEALTWKLEKISAALKKPTLEYDTITDPLDSEPDIITPEMSKELSKHANIKDMSDDLNLPDEDDS